MEFCEIEGERKGSKVLVTEDKHLYRYAKPNTPYLICYLGEITKTMQKTSPHVAKCPATATLKEGKINLRKVHNHEPDLRIHDRLSARKKARDGVAKSSQPTRQAFDEALRHESGAELVGWGNLYRTCLRDRRNTYPPPPSDCEAADEFMTSDQYKDKQFAQFYQGCVTGEEESDKALVFAHPGNIAKLGEDTKQLNCDGTFRTAPSLSVGHLYQILIILAMFREHMFPIVKAIMTGKKR